MLIVVSGDSNPELTLGSVRLSVWCLVRTGELSHNSWSATSRAGRKTVRPGNAGQAGSNEVISSRNLVGRLAGAKPAWPGVSPPELVVSLATGAVTLPAKRRHTSAWAVGNAATKSTTYQVPRVLLYSKATTSRPKWGTPDRVVGRVGGYVQRRSRDILQKVGPAACPAGGPSGPSAS